MHKVIMKMLFDVIGLLVAEIDGPDRLRDIKAILFESAEGEAALATLEIIGLAIVPVEIVTEHWDPELTCIEISQAEVEVPVL